MEWYEINLELKRKNKVEPWGRRQRTEGDAPLTNTWWPQQLQSPAKQSTLNWRETPQTGFWFNSSTAETSSLFLFGVTSVQSVVLQVWSEPNLCSGFTSCFNNLTMSLFSVCPSEHFTGVQVKQFFWCRRFSSFSCRVNLPPAEEQVIQPSLCFNGNV